MRTAVRRIGRAAALLGVIVAVNFILPRLLPGTPLSGGGAESVVLPAGAAAEIRAIYDLDRPTGEQFTRYLGALARGDFGRSIASHRPVGDLLADRLPRTLWLMGLALALSVALGGWLGTASLWRPRGAAARLAAPVLVALGALPEALVALLLIVLLGTKLRWLPAFGASTPFLDRTAPVWLQAADLLRHAALPSLTLVAALLPAFLLLSRSVLAPVVSAPYLTVARGKGLGEGRVLWHAWRNAMPAMLTLLGLRVAFAVSGAAVVERIFAYPGMGLLLFEAIARRDYPVMQGVFLVGSAAVIAMTLVLDLLAAVLDPRLREEAA